MATLETIRTKAGVLISIVIGIALVSFIINADTLRMVMDMFSSKNDVGVIAKESISYTDFNQKVAQFTQLQQIATNQQALTAEQQDEVENKAWTYFLYNKVLFPEFEKTGVGVSEAELADALTGDNPVDEVRQLFTDRETGQFNREQLRQVLGRMATDINLKTYWMSLETQTYENKLIRKYVALMQKSQYVSTVEAKFVSELAGKTFNFDYIVKDYASIPDSAVKVTNSDYQKYYDDHKSEFEQMRGRDIEFVFFPLQPNADDYSKAANTVQEIKSQFAAVPAAEVPAFVQQNSDAPFDDVYKKKGELKAVGEFDLDSFAFVQPIGTVSEFYQGSGDDTYYVSRVADRKMIADSVHVAHILLGEANFMKADSIYELIKNGASFEALALEFSMDTESKTKGGELPWFAFNGMPRPLSDSCFYNPVGKLMKISAQYGVHIVKILAKKDETLKAQIATIAVVTTVGKNTENTIFAQANALASASKANAADFKKFAVDNALRIQKAENIQMGAKDILMVKNAKSIVRWAYDAKVGDVSNVETVDNNNGYMVACLDQIKEAGFAPLAQVKEQIQPQVIQGKKAEMITKELLAAVAKTSSLDELATQTNTKVMYQNAGVNFSASYIPTINTPEPKLIGAVTASAQDVLSKPIEGNAGVYLYKVTSVTPGVNDPVAEKIRIESSKQASVYEFYSVLIKNAKIVDNRGRFY